MQMISCKCLLTLLSEIASLLPVICCCLFPIDIQIKDVFMLEDTMGLKVSELTSALFSCINLFKLHGFLADI